jgi:hypothetical protein
MILSIDVGIVNLAMVLLDENNKNKIVEWSVGGVPMQSDIGLFKNMVGYLDSNPWVLQSDIILIEKQPGKNKKMKSVEYMLHTYFICRCPNSEVIIYDAKYKIPDIVGGGKKQYTKRKNAAIDRCLAFLENNEMNKHLVDFFKSHKKKDDLADVVMQALSFIPSKDKKMEKATQVKKVSPRRPTEHQKESRYSRANLAWFIKEDGVDKCLQNKRFLKDLKKYYTSVEQLLKALK